MGSIPGFSRWPALCVLVVMFSVAFEFSSASPTPQKHARTSHDLRPRAIEPDGVLNCETERSSDYYGLGVRIGVYFSWMQAWIANVAVPSEIPMALDTNTIFLFAILVAMIKCTLTQLLLQLDGLVLMHISGGTIFSVLSVWGYRTCCYEMYGPVEGIRNFGGYGTHLRLLLCTAVSSFGMFYWVYGIRGALPWDADEGCEVIYTFMFSKVRADGPIRTYYIFVCIACMVYFGSMLLVSLVALPTKLKRLMHAHKQGQMVPRVRMSFATGLTQKQLRYIFYFLRIGNLLFILFSMILVEFTLNYNHVAGVLGWRGHIFFPAQVIPMIIGAFGFTRVVYIRYQQWKDPANLHTSSRSVFKSKPKELFKLYTPKANLSMESIPQVPDHHIDPLLARAQPLWLRLLVSWLPWLALLRWWPHDASDGARGSMLKRDRESDQQKHCHRDGYGDSSGSGSGVDGKNDNDSGPRSPNALLGTGWMSNEPTPRVGTFMSHTDTWDSDETAADTISQVPRAAAAATAKLRYSGTV